MKIPLPYSPRKFDDEWLESLKCDSRIFTDEFLESWEGEYPCSDGEPVAETDWHMTAMSDTRSVLQLLYKDQSNVYIGANNFLYWDEDNMRACVSPDLYVVRGVDKRPKRVYKVWEEGGKTPNVVFEFTSKGTKETDFEEKLTLYGDTLKVREYFLFDPDEKYLSPPLKGYRLFGDAYQPIDPKKGRLFSNQLGLEMEAEGMHIRFYDPKTGLALPFMSELAASVKEETERAEAQTRRADTETKRADALEAELAELRKLLNQKL